MSSDIELIQYSLKSIGSALQELNENIRKFKKVKDDKSRDNLVLQLAYDIGHITSSYNVMISMASNTLNGISEEGESLIGFRDDTDP